MPFEFRPLSLPGVVLVTPRIFTDERGFFMETYHHGDFASAGLTEAFVQENHSRSVKRTLRGLHYQRAPKAQAKLIRVLTGEIFDVVVDLRHDQPSFGTWLGMTLSSADRCSLYVPEWCAHGFCVLSDTAEVLYKTTAEYAPDLESGIAWNDPGLAIKWPVVDPILSLRDQQWPALALTGEAHERAHRD